jgi:fumarate hydratase, class II
MSYRIEKDSMGEVRVPSDKIWGAQTQRSLENFDISSRTFPLPFIKALIEVKRACALANKELGQLDDKIGTAIEKAADLILEDGKYHDMFPLDIFQTGSGTQTNMNANEVLANLAIQVLGGTIGEDKMVHPNDHVNRGQSSNDVIPTAMHISSLYELINQLIPSLEKLITSVSNKSAEFKDIIKIGRTHLQDAVPCTLGQEFQGYVYQLKNSKSILIDLGNHLKPLALGGTAVGTGLNAHPEMPAKAISILSDRMDIAFSNSNRGSKFALLAAKDELVGLSGGLKTLAVALIKIANDIRLMGSGPRVGIGELLLPENEPGSSIMPGKVNPTQAEMLVQVCAQVIGNDTAVTHGGIQGYFELNLMKPMIISNVLESIDILARGMNSFRKNCIDGLQANTSRIASLIDQSLMVVTALTTFVKSDGSIPYPYDEAARVAKHAYTNDLTIREVLQQEGKLSDEEITKALNLSKMVNPHDD